MSAEPIFQTKKQVLQLLRMITSQQGLTGQFFCIRTSFPGFAFGYLFLLKSEFFYSLQGNIMGTFSSSNRFQDCVNKNANYCKATKNYTDTVRRQNHATPAGYWNVKRKRHHMNRLKS
ncbi:MAG: hypothetical protein JWR61_4559 [Ferruginibacter sp.]|nr:hypothetical protein [Ferruginibacter sp.]